MLYQCMWCACGSHAGLAPVAVGVGTHCLRALCLLQRLFAEEETMHYERACDKLDTKRIPVQFASVTSAAASADCGPTTAVPMLDKIQLPM